MTEKQFNTRIVHKHDTAENWAKAVNFIPKQGEIIVYDIDDNNSYERIKIGDGVTVVDELPFAITYPVTSVNGKVGAVSLVASDVSAVPTTRTINSKALDADITLTAEDVGALPNTTEIPSIEGLATESYVDTKVAAMVDSAPETLNTLNELAAALGDDPNFATTVATQIGKKVDKTTTINGQPLSTDITLSASDVNAYSAGTAASLISNLNIKNGQGQGSVFQGNWGSSTKAIGSYSHAEGNGVIAFGLCSHAEGSGSSATYGITISGAADTVVYVCNQQPPLGKLKSIVSVDDELFAQLLEIGTNETGENIITVSNTLSKTTLDSAILRFYDGTANGRESHVEGIDSIANGDSSHAEGNRTKANGRASHTEGNNTSTNGDYSHAEGYTTQANGNSSHAEGKSTYADGDYSHAEGSSTTANGDYSHTEGNNTTANGNYSHAEGYFSTANGDYSHAEGKYTLASSEYQHAQGKYNIEDASNKYTHIIGNGIGINNRSNAHTLDWDGNARFAGDVYVNGTGDNDLVDAKIVATQEYVTEAINAALAALGLPTPTTADAGKFLRVNTEGKYELVSIPNAEEATF